MILDDYEQELIEKFKKLIQKSKKVITFVHHSNVCAENLKRKQSEKGSPLHKLIQDAGSLELYLFDT